jgi:hypothetical protein
MELIGISMLEDAAARHSRSSWVESRAYSSALTPREHERILSFM